MVNLTQHQSTSEQKLEGVVDLPEEERKELKKLLTFDVPPTKEEMVERAEAIAELVYRVHEDLKKTRDEFSDAFMIGGAPFFMPVLAHQLSKAWEWQCYYAFSERVVEENPETGEKYSVFKHVGFVPHVFTPQPSYTEGL